LRYRCFGFLAEDEASIQVALEDALEVGGDQLVTAEVALNGVRFLDAGQPNIRV
jgi:hypothetical protein